MACFYFIGLSDLWLTQSKSDQILSSISCGSHMFNMLRGLCSYAIKRKLSSLSPKELGIATGEKCFTPSFRKEILAVRTYSSFSPPLHWPRPKPRQREHTQLFIHRLKIASSIPVALLTAGEGVVTNTAGSCWRKVAGFLWSTEWYAEQCDFPVLLTVSVLGKAGELASKRPMQGSKFHSCRITKSNKK